MKLLTKDQENALWDANIAGGLRGALYATGICAPGVFLLQRNSHTFRQLPLPLKAFGVVVVSVPLVFVSAEKAGEAYERSLWTGAGVRELQSEARRREERWEGMGTMERVKEWSKAHQYSLVGGSWAASMILAGTVVARNPYLTFPQKLVQARMWAQGLTVGVLIGSGVLAGVNSQGEKARPEEEEDHSWRTMLDETAKEEKSKAVRMPAAAK